MLQYVRKLGVGITFLNSISVVKVGNKYFDDVLYKLTINRDIQKARELSIQGPFFCLSDIYLKPSRLVLYNWSVQDSLVIFAVKARLSLLPSNFTHHM